MEPFKRLQQDYPWTKSPLVSCGPMRLIALADLAVEVSRAGGLGFIGGGSDASILEKEFEQVKQLQAGAQVLKELDVLPVGVGFLLWAGDNLLNEALPAIVKYVPAAVWLFAPHNLEQFTHWTGEIRKATRGSGSKSPKIWIQVGTVAEAVEVTKTCQPDVLVVQGQDAGGHGLMEGAGLVPLLPEVDDAVTAASIAQKITKPVITAAGGIMDGRGAAAALSLGAAGVTLGTRYLVAPESNIAKGYRDAVMSASDGGVNTARGKLYDTLRGTRDWPAHFGGRGVLNETWHDDKQGMSIEENQRLYDEAVKKGDEGWGDKARLTTYAGAGVGLANSVKSAARITEEVREDAKRILKQVSKFV